jgi:thiol-disulfide isomerase/thioredoxin
VWRQTGEGLFACESRNPSGAFWLGKVKSPMKSITRGVSQLMIRSLVLISVLVVCARAQQPDSLSKFSLPRLDGQTLRSQELTDSIVVLDFWATWCENCVGEIPAFNKLEKEYRSGGVKVIGLAVQSGWASDIQKFVKQYDMRYTILVGNDDTVSDFGVISFPNTYVIGPGWKLYKKYSGVSETKSADIRQDIETLLKAKR